MDVGLRANSSGSKERDAARGLEIFYLHKLKGMPLREVQVEDVR